MDLVKYFNIGFHTFVNSKKGRNSGICPNKNV